MTLAMVQRNAKRVGKNQLKKSKHFLSYKLLPESECLKSCTDAVTQDKRVNLLTHKKDPFMLGPSNLLPTNSIIFHLNWTDFLYCNDANYMHIVAGMCI